MEINYPRIHRFKLATFGFKLAILFFVVLKTSAKSTAQKCEYSVLEDKIIDIIFDENDGKEEFLEAVENAETEDECKDFCCAHDVCNVIVFAKNEDTKCFLLDCSKGCHYKSSANGERVISLSRNGSPNPDLVSLDPTTTQPASSVSEVSSGSTKSGTETNSGNESATKLSDASDSSIATEGSKAQSNSTTTKGAQSSKTTKTEDELKESSRTEHTSSSSVRSESSTYSSSESKGRSASHAVSSSDDTTADLADGTTTNSDLESSGKIENTSSEPGKELNSGLSSSSDSSSVESSITTLEANETSEESSGTTTDSIITDFLSIDDDNDDEVDDDGNDDNDDDTNEDAGNATTDDSGGKHVSSGEFASLESSIKEDVSKPNGVAVFSLILGVIVLMVIAIFTFRFFYDQYKRKDYDKIDYLNRSMDHDD